MWLQSSDNRCFGRKPLIISLWSIIFISDLKYFQWPRRVLPVDWWTNGLIAEASTRIQNGCLLNSAKFHLLFGIILDTKMPSSSLTFKKFNTDKLHILSKHKLHSLNRNLENWLPVLLKTTWSGFEWLVGKSIPIKIPSEYFIYDRFILAAETINLQWKI